MTKPLTSDRGVGQGGNVLYVFDDDVISFYSIRNKMPNNGNNYRYAKLKKKNHFPYDYEFFPFIKYTFPLIVSLYEFSNINQLQ